MSFTRYGSPVTSEAEFKFNKWFKASSKETLFPDDDWFHRRTNTLFEIKEIKYPLSHFKDGIVRMNQTSLDRHYAIRGRYRRIYVIAMFTDKNMFSDIESVVKAASKDVANHFGDRSTYFVPLSIFKPLEDVNQLLS